MNREVEILKIGSIVPAIISKHEVNEGKKEGKDTIMVVYNGGPIFDYYVNILKENCGDGYKYLRTDKAIVGRPETFRSSLLGKSTTNSIKGIQDNEPIVGQSYSIDGHWRTSEVKKIINNNIIITKNSVYVIHDISELRDKKINDLGI